MKMVDVLNGLRLETVDIKAGPRFAALDRNKVVNPLLERRVPELLTNRFRERGVECQTVGGPTERVTMDSFLPHSWLSRPKACHSPGKFVVTHRCSMSDSAIFRQMTDSRLSNVPKTVLLLHFEIAN